ncbi:MAG: mevalonate kinase [Chloroflexi bacterium]|nr:mevalonate kinase [Chloroflexota bacterium]MCC6891325.1 mevalonate kinase [Anaerolineae bacterium]
MNVTKTASAKIILLGEHSVVYGQPAIAVPVTALRASAKFVSGSTGTGLRIVAPDVEGLDLYIASLETADVSNPFVAAIRLFLSHFQIALPDATVELRSQIPIASGLGSGAALTTALLRALADVVRVSIDPSVLNNMVYEIEKLFHGTPSGIDNTVIVYERPVYFVRSQPIEQLVIGKPFRLVIGDTGVSASTKVAVSDVRKLYDSDQTEFSGLFDEIGSLVIAGRGAIEHGDEVRLGSIMDQNHELLQQLTVSSPELDNLVVTARRAGALGAKMSGGGRGGNMIALVAEPLAQSVMNALLESGAVRIYETVVGKD